MKSKSPRAYFAICVLCFAACVLNLSGCDPIARHKVLTTFFDGVPSLPPPDELCKEHVEKMKAMEAMEASTRLEQEKAAPGAPRGSAHQPYSEKRCDDCHDKDKPDGLIRPKKDLCFVCHTDFVNGAFVHGPVAVGDCLACHLPHTASFSSLLKVDKSQLCSTCHREKRLSVSLHDTVVAKKMNCPDCHDPHFGDVRYFLK